MSVEPQPRRKHRTLSAPDATVKMARKLRKEMSLPEILLWRQLQRHPGAYRFRKQHPIGRYALDFACLRARLAIEVDGEAHERSDRPQRDEIRDAWLLKQGFATLRLPAVAVLHDMDGVLAGIVEACRQRARPNPPRNGEVAAKPTEGPLSASGGVRGTRPLPLHRPADGPPPRSGEDFTEFL